MKEMLEKLAGKRPDEQDGDDHAHAKMQVLHELRNMAMDMMGDKVKGRLPHEMHGAEVIAPDKEGLQKGLDLAKEVASSSGLPHQGSNGSPMDEGAEEAEEQTEHGRSEPEGDEGEPDQHMLNPHRDASTEDDGDDMYGDMDHEELDQHIQHLQKLKQAKAPKRY